MNRLNKKGFTIVELVIVIAVIAILAAVLIPTFSGIIKKANQTADIQAARQMDVALQAESIIETPADIETVVDILAGAGYAAEESLKPITTDHAFYWHKTYNAIVLANEEDDNNPVVLYPSNNEALATNFKTDKAKSGDNMVLYDLAESSKYVVVKADNAAGLAEALAAGGNITLTADITLDKNTTIPTEPWDEYYDEYGYYSGGLFNIPEGSTTTLDLGGKELTINVSGMTEMVRIIFNCGTFTLKNGTLNFIGEVSGETYLLYNEKDATGAMNIEDVIITSNVDQSYVISNSSDFSMSNTTVNAKKGCFYEDSGKITMDNCTFNSEQGKSSNNNKVYVLEASGLSSSWKLNNIKVNISNTDSEVDVIAIYEYWASWGIANNTFEGDITLNGTLITYPIS